MRIGLKQRKSGFITWNIANLAAFAIASLICLCPVSFAQSTPVLTRGYNNARTGANLSETQITQATIKAKGITRRGSLVMQGDERGIEAQPLIATKVPMDDGTTRDIIILADMNNTVWAFDAHTYQLVWSKELAPSINGNTSIDAWMINDHWGIFSTPVIDPDTNQIYIVAWTSPDGTPQKAQYYVHVLRLKDASRVCAPVLVTGTSNGQAYDSYIRKQRTSLLLTNVGGVKTVFFASGTVQETGTGAAGFVFAFDVASNTIKSVLAMSAGKGAGVWMAGGGLVADSAGNIYLTTGNGSFNGATDFGESVVKLSYTGSKLAVADWWSPFTDSGKEGLSVSGMDPAPTTAKLAGTNAATSEVNLPVNMSHMRAMVAAPNAAAATDAGWNDEDLGSAGLTLIGNVLVVSGKDGIVYLVNSANMGKTKPADFANAAANYAKLLSPPEWFTFFPGYGVNAAPQNPDALDVLYFGKTHHMHSTPVSYVNSKGQTIVFCWGENGTLRAWQLSNGVLTFLAQSAATASPLSVNSPGGMAGGFMALSANGTTTGTPILWATVPDGDANKTVGPGTLYTFDAENFTNGVIRQLWSSKDWGIAFTYNKFNPPVEDDGTLLVPTYADTVDVYTQ